VQTASQHDDYAEATIRQDNVPDGAVLLTATSTEHGGPLKIGFLGKFQFNAEERTTLELQIHRDGQPVVGARCRLCFDEQDEVTPAIEWLWPLGSQPALYEIVKTRGQAIDFVGGTLALRPLVG